MTCLFLHSDQVLPQSESMERHLTSTIGKEFVRMAYLPSAHDKQRRYFIPKQEYYAGFGIELCYIDIFDGHQAFSPDVLNEFDAVHLSGGHTGHFLTALKARGLLKILKLFAQKGGVLSGVSAGAIMLTQRIRIASAINALDRETPLKKDEALGLVDFEFFPHLDEQPETCVEELQNYANRWSTRIFACSDGSGVCVTDTKVTLFGDVRIFEPKTKGTLGVSPHAALSRT